LFEALEATFDGAPDLVCFSHLRWNFVYQRPQHLMSRCARQRRVFFVEEPIFEPPKKRASPHVDLTLCPSGVCVVVPRLPLGLSEDDVNDVLRGLIDRLFARCAVRDAVFWYYTPMALEFTRQLEPLAVVYDCMDELSNFRGAPQDIRVREAELLARADVVFTGGASLFEAKRDLHPNIHPFPSSIDAAHFAQARGTVLEPPDQASFPRPRLGFSGVIDERMDLELLDGVAQARPDWQLVMLGPVVKIDPAELPKRPNIHYLGPKSYAELPAYMAGWDVALLPFARNDSTRFISPTKTPEYLAAGRPVVSTSIRDVVRVYGEPGLARIADTVPDFVAAAAAALDAPPQPEWLARVDSFLGESSWDRTWDAMMRLLGSAIDARVSSPSRRPSAFWPLAAVAAARRSPDSPLPIDSNSGIGQCSTT